MSEEILRMDNITKTYSNGVIANKDVSFQVYRGEIHALMGENGAGKSTLMKILFGLEPKDSGEIYFEGKKLESKSPIDTIKQGIGMVHQHFMLINSLKVYENVILGMEPKKGLFTDTASAIKLVEEYSQKYNLKIDPNAKVANLSVGLKQKIEILKVLVRGAKLLILDEPTAVLTPQETEELFQQLLLLRNNGHTIIFISHKIKEVLQICDRITVLRRGRTIGTMDVKNSSEEEISRFMVGRDVVLNVEKSSNKFGDALLTVKNLSYRNDEGRDILRNVSFKLHRGQILGVAGIEGNGQNELAECIFGLRKSNSGEISFSNNNLLKLNIKDIRSLGVSYIPEDRLTTGVAGHLSIWENLIADRVDNKALKKHGLLNRKQIKELSRKLINEYKILCRNSDQNVGMLSGGNVQKVVIAREFSSKPKLLIANQPSRGVDVGAMEFIWKQIVDFREQGNGVLLISADLNEILELSDSILVMTGGEVAAYFPDSKKVTEYELGLYMLGLKKQSEEERGNCNEE